MKIEKLKGNNERRVLIGMIVDSVVLGRIDARWEANLFYSKWANIVAAWCVKYYNQYQKAPMYQIESLYESWVADTGVDKDTIRLVEKFLGEISNQYKKLKREINSEYIIDIAGKFFNAVKINQLIDTVQGDIELGKIDEANNRIVGFNRVELGGCEGVDVLHDKSIIREAFADRGDPLITYPGALGKFFGGHLERDGFISFMGPEKRGKTWWLIDVAWRGMLCRRNVAFFAVGDQSRNQMMLRFLSRVAHYPIRPCKLFYPKEIEREKGSAIADVTQRRKIYRKGLSPKLAIQRCEELIKHKTGKRKFLKLSCHPNSSMNVKGITGIIQGWERGGWLPDIIVIDYADILDMSYFGFEGRERINETWKQLRRLSQQLHCLVVTATQADSASYGKHTLSMNNFSDDKRKTAHVTGMVGINQTEEEKELGLMRLNWVALREGEYSQNKCVHVAGCLGLGNPAILSCF